MTDMHTDVFVGGYRDIDDATRDSDARGAREAEASR